MSKQIRNSDLLMTVALLFLIGVPSANAQTEDADQRSELGARQQLVERKMVELENRFTTIAERLKEQEPERHQRLIQAYQNAKENLITKKMAEVTRLLDIGKLAEADKLLDDVIDQLDELVRFLLNSQDKALDKQQQLAQLEQWKQSIQSMRREQTAQRQETGKVANKDSELKKLEQQIRKLDGLIDRQRGLIDQTRQSEGEGLREMDKVADQQFELRRETEQLAREVSGQNPEADNDSNPDRTGDAQSGTPTDQQGANPDSPESGQNDGPEDSDRQSDSNQDPPSDPAGQPQQGQQQSGQQQSGQQQSGQEQPGQEQPGQQQPGQQQSGQEQSGQQPSQNQPPQPGQQPLEQSAKAQANAEEDLGSGRPKDAQREQNQALTELEKARAELKKEKRRLASLPPEAVENMARSQRRTKDQAMDLIEKMAKAPEADGNSDEQVSQQNDAQQPGQQPMQQAAEEMNKAAENLEEQDAKKAERKQRDAEKKLDEALEEIEERLNQLRDETREEKLKRLEGRFTEMLDRQRSVSSATIDIEDRKVNLNHQQRRDRLVVLRLATEEAEISELGQQAYDLLLEDGTSDVFPEMVQDVRSDLLRAGQLLQEERTDPLTQLMQQEIESSLLDLLEALAESKEESGQQSGGGGGGGGDQPLLKRSAELKMLKAAQQRLNRKTTQLDRIRLSQSGHIDSSLDGEVEGLSGQQSKLQEMAEQIMEKDE